VLSFVRRVVLLLSVLLIAGNAQCAAYCAATSCQTNVPPCHRHHPPAPHHHLEAACHSAAVLFGARPAAVAVAETPVPGVPLLGLRAQETPSPPLLLRMRAPLSLRI